MTTRRDWILAATRRLQESGIEAPRLVADLLLAHVLDIPRVALIAHDDQPLAHTDHESADALVSRRLQGEPLAYIVETVEFYGRRFTVTPAVLIPRNETEDLVTEALALIDVRQRLDAPWRALDLGTGSGAIAVTLAAERADGEVWVTDISACALQVAAENAWFSGVSERVHLLEGFWFTPLSTEMRGTFDVIACNPPYVDPAERRNLRPEVLIQPGEALFAGDPGEGGLTVYRTIIPLASEWLQPGGWLLLELGAGQATAVTEMARNAGFVEVSVTPDLAGILRVLAARRPA